MRGINTYTLSFLTFAALAKACAYGDMLGEPGEDQDYRYCRVGCGLGDMTPTNPDYMACCVGFPKGASVPATCTAIAESKSIITCTHTSLATTDSTNMQAPTDYKPAYATAAATSAAAVTSDTAGQSYESAASAVTTWVTETASPDCAVPSSTEAAASSTPPAEPTYPSSSIVTAEPTYPPSSSSPAPSETYSSAAPAYTCACPEAVSSAPAPAETSDTHGESYTSEDGSPSPPYGSKPGEGDDVSNLDRRLFARTDVQYTCECPTPGAETSDTAGESYSSTSSSAPPAEPTDDCEDDDPSPPYGAKPDGEIVDNAPPAKRFIPLNYSIPHPINKRVMYGPPDADFIPEDGVVIKRNGPTEAVSDNVVLPTVTSTTTITASCSATDAAQTNGYDTSATLSNTGEWTSGELVTSSAAAETTGGNNGLSGAVSGVIDGSSFALTGTLAIPTDNPSPPYGSKADGSDGEIVDNARKRSKPDGEVIDNHRKRRRGSWV